MMFIRRIFKDFSSFSVLILKKQDIRQWEKLIAWSYSLSLVSQSNELLSNMREKKEKNTEKKKRVAEIIRHRTDRTIPPWQQFIIIENDVALYCLLSSFSFPRSPLFSSYFIVIIACQLLSVEKEKKNRDFLKNNYLFVYGYEQKKNWTSHN